MLKVGDVIQCHDAKECAEYLMALIMENYNAEPIMSMNGQLGYWLKITRLPIETTMKHPEEMR